MSRTDVRAKDLPETIDSGLLSGYDLDMDTNRKENQMDPSSLNVAKLGQLAGGNPKPRDLEKATIMEIKYDGHRVYMYRGADDKRVRTFARSGNEKSGLLRTVERIVKRLPEGTWLDGEACSFKSDGTNDWGVAQSVLGAGSERPDLAAKITFVVFDILSYDGHDVRSLPLKARRELLEEAFEAAGIFESDAIMLSPQFDASQEAYDALVAAGHEGAIVKDPTAPYTSGGRGKGWFKMKATETLDVVVTGTKDGKGKFAGLIGALRFDLQDAQGNWVGGKDGLGFCSGMNDAQRIRFTEQHERGELIGTVIEIAHMGWMSETSVRHPQFKRIRTDKDAATLTFEDQRRSA